MKKERVRTRKNKSAPKKTGNLRIAHHSKISRRKIKTARTYSKLSSLKRIVKKTLPVKIKRKTLQVVIAARPRLAPAISKGRNGAVSKPAPSSMTDLPFSYNETKLALLVRDPTWAFAYWDFSAETWNWIQDFYRRENTLRPKLRIHNLNDRSFFDLDIDLESKNWYIELGRPDTDFEAELGLLDSRGRFHRIAKSNRIHTPRNRPSDKIGPHWNASEFDEMYKLWDRSRAGFGSGSAIFSRGAHKF